MHLPVALAAVSQAVQAILRQEFARNALVIPNSIDCNRFHPGPVASLQPTKVLEPSNSQVGTLQRRKGLWFYLLRWRYRF